MKKLLCRLFGHKFESVGRAYCVSWDKMKAGPARAHEICRCMRCKEYKMVEVNE